MAERFPAHLGRGRGAAIKEMLRKHQEAEAGGKRTESAIAGGQDDDGRTQKETEITQKVPAIIRGRAILLQKLQSLSEKHAGTDLPPAGLLEKHETKLERESLDTEKKIESVSQTLQHTSISHPSIEHETTQKHYRGETGRPIKVAVNYIKLNIEKNRGVFEYEVRFEPTIDARSNRIRLVNQQLGEIATTKVFDGGSCLYLPVKLYEGRKEFKATLPNADPSEEVTVIFIFKQKKQLTDCLHLYNVLFKRIMHVLLYKQIGRNYFNMDHKHLIPQHKMEVYPGYTIHVDEIEGGLMLSLDTQHKVIRSETVYELLHTLYISNPREFKDSAFRNIVGTVVLTKYNNKTYTIDDIDWNANPKNTFPTRDGNSMDFITYYKKQYNIDIGDLQQPMLISRKNITIQEKKVEQIICLVPELCFVTGLSETARKDFTIMKDVAAYTRITPNQRFLALRTYIENVNKSELAQKVLTGWGLKIDDSIVNLNARVLNGEKIFFGNGEGVMTQDWGRALTENQITGPVDIVRWILVYTNRDRNVGRDFAESIQRIGRGLGCVIKPPKHILLDDDRSETYMRVCKENITSELQIIVFICPTLRADRYSVIKKVCCVQLPIASQVILGKTLSNPKRIKAVIQNIAMQMVCKLGGNLWSIRLPFHLWMICGIDVYHGKGHQSVCGFVAGINDGLTKWFSVCSFQDREVGDFFKASFKSALVISKNLNGQYPSRVIIFRDGVGNGQLEHVRRYELTQFEEALSEMQIEATITLIVVQKRINTRIFAVHGERNVDNPPSGTIVDSVITRKNYYDFYLVPQSVRQGTVNPTHYIVVHDSSNLKPDTIQMLAYKLCHLYYNWSGTIRVPAPCLNAHKLAGITGQYIKKAPSMELSQRLWYL